MSNPSEPDSHFNSEISNMDEDTADHSAELVRLAQFAGFDLGVLGNELIIEIPALDAPPILPGCGDLMMAKVERIGHRGEFPMPKEWENLLAMLEPGHELLWIITKRPEQGFSYYVAVKSNGTPHLNPDKAKELKSAFKSNIGQFTKRSFPESITKDVPTDEILNVIRGILDHSNGEVIVTSGYPSANDIEDNREFYEQGKQSSPDGSLNDIVEPFTSENSFSIVFTVERADANVATERLSQMLDLRSVISPHLKVQKGETTSLSEGESRGEQTSSGINISQSENRSKIHRMFQSVFGSKAGAIRKLSSAESGISEQSRLIEAALESKKSISKKGAWWKGSAASLQKTTTKSVTETVTETRQTGTSRTLTHSNALFEHVDQKLQDSIRSLKKASGTGAYFMAAEVFSPSTELSLRIARSISGSLAGAKTHTRPFQTAAYRGTGFGDHLLTIATIDTLYPAITVESRHVAAQFLPVPEADLPGLRTKKNVFYGKPNAKQHINGQSASSVGSGNVWLGNLSHLGNGVLKSQDRAFLISEKDLTSHLLIAGTTGSGKTQRAAAILNRLSTEKFRVVVIESAKKTYRKLLRRKGVNSRILALGETGADALRINPFYFEPGTSLKRHISIFSDALADLLPVEALIGPKLREAIQRCYIRYEWDIEAGAFRGKGVPVFPTMVDLHMEVFAVAKSLNYGPEMTSNYKGALLGRSRLFIDELYQDIFGWGGSKSLEEMFGEDDVIIEMDSLPPSEAKMPSFVLSVLLERMRSWQQLARHERRTTHRDIILVIEEAHNLLEKSLEGKQSGHEMGAGRFLLQQIVRLLQEGREAGIGVVVVDQSPASLADAVVRNTNTKIILRITDAEEAEKIGSTLGLSKEECRDLHELEDGESVVKVKNAGRAIKLSPLDDCELATTDLLEQSEFDQGNAHPDYYRAAKAIFEISDLLKADVGREENRSIEVHLDLAIEELKAASGENEEVGRFFRQKLLATVTERLDADMRSRDNTCPSFAELPLLLSKRVKSPSVDVLQQQLKCLFAAMPWNDARQFFMDSVLPALPLLYRYLENDVDWRVVSDAASSFIDHLTVLNMSSSDESTKENSYTCLIIICHGSPARIEIIRRICLLH